MIVKIWRVLTQILFYRNDLIKTIKPFFENLKNKNIHDEKYLPLLKTFSTYHLKVLYKNKIITEKKFNSLVPKNQFYLTEETNSTVNDINSKIEEIISGDKIKELQKLLQERDIKTFNTITKSNINIVNNSKDITKEDLLHSYLSNLIQIIKQIIWIRFELILWN